MTAFDYSNLSDRPAGPFVRIGSKLSPGIRKVQQQIVPYAAAWGASNLAALKAEGLLWVVLGDSMSQGVGATRYDRGWVGQLADKFAVEGRPYRIINLSVSGVRVSDVLERQLPALAELGIQPDLVTVLIGSNDMVRKKYRQELPLLFADMLQKLPAGTVVANLPGRHQLAFELNRLIQEAVQTRGMVLADLQDMASWRGKVAEDHYHPNEAGYAGLAAVFETAIKQRP